MTAGTSRKPAGRSGRRRTTGKHRGALFGTSSESKFRSGLARPATAPHSAQAAWIGARFLAAEEAVTHPHYQSRVLAAEASDTHYSTFYDVGWPDAPHRVLRNSTIDAWDKAGRPPPGSRPGEGEIIVGAGEDDRVVRYETVSARKDYQGDVEAMPLWAGQGVGLVRRRQPAAEIVAEIVAEAEAVIAGLARFQSL